MDHNTSLTYPGHVPPRPVPPPAPPAEQVHAPVEAALNMPHEVPHEVPRTAVHPSRSAPLCKDCQHVERDGNGHAASYCNHPSTPAFTFDGSAAVSVSTMRTRHSATVLARLEFVPCGPEAALFEPCFTCKTCGGAGSLREPYSRDFTDCPDCLTSRISVATATTVASEKPAGNRA